jgi:hypothetical protein
MPPVTTLLAKAYTHVLYHTCYTIYTYPPFNKRLPRVYIHRTPLPCWRANGSSKKNIEPPVAG